MPHGPGDAEPPPDTQGNAAVGGTWAWAFKPTPAAARAMNRGAEGGQRDCTTLARPNPPPPPPEPAECRWRLGDVGPVPPPPSQGSPPPPLPLERAAALGAERHWVHAPRAPERSPARSHSDLGKPRRQPACQTARQPPAGTQGRPTAPHSDRAQTGAHGHEPEQYGGHTFHGLTDANEARLGARARKAERQAEAERPPTPHAPEGGSERTPPPRTAPDAQARPRRDARPRARQGDEGTGPPPPAPDLTRQSTGPGRETRRGTNHLERPYQRPAPEPRLVREPHRPGGGGGRTRKPGEHERTHTQRARGVHLKKDQTEPAECTDRMKWRTDRQGEGTPGRDDRPHAPRGARGKGGGGKGEEGETATATTPRTCRERRAHTTKALHPPRQ